MKSCLVSHSRLKEMQYGNEKLEREKNNSNYQIIYFLTAPVFSALPCWQYENIQLYM